MSRQKLNLDLDSLFPGESLSIGETTIVIKPLGFEQIAILTKKLNGMGALLVEKGVTWDNYNTPQHLFTIGSILLENFPDVLEEAADVDIEDLKKVPLEVIIQIVETVITVNLKSKDALAKNFKSLATNFTDLIPKVEKETPKLKKIKKK